MTHKLNTDFDWDAFDPRTYLQHNYASIRDDDAALVAWTAAAFRSEITGLNVVDVGTGSNLYPILCALPRASKMTAWEYAKSNIDWLKTKLVAPALDPEWRAFWDKVRAAYAPEGLPDDPSPLLNHVSMNQGSIFDLPTATFDAATMFFCAESITTSPDEFRAACRCFAKSVKTGGLLVAAFMEGSRGYRVSSVDFPAVAIGIRDLETAFADVSENVEIARIDSGTSPVRDGYTGMLFLTARAI